MSSVYAFGLGKSKIKSFGKDILIENTFKA